MNQLIQFDCDSFQFVAIHLLSLIRTKLSISNLFEDNNYVRVHVFLLERRTMLYFEILKNKIFNVNLRRLQQLVLKILEQPQVYFRNVVLSHNPISIAISIITSISTTRVCFFSLNSLCYIVVSIAKENGMELVLIKMMVCAKSGICRKLNRTNIFHSISRIVIYQHQQR